MRRPRMWLVLAGGLGACAGGLLLSPWWSLAGLVEAVSTGDRYRMELYVDFPRLRESIALQLKAYMAQEVEKSLRDNPFAALGTVIGSAVVDRTVEAYVSPAGLGTLVQRVAGTQMQSDGRSRLGIALGLYKHTRLEWLSPSSIRVDFSDDEGHAPSRGRIERSGLHWRLVDVDVQPGWKPPYPANVVQNFVAACRAQASEDVCECAIDRIQRRFTLDEFGRFESRMAQGETPQELVELVADCKVP